MPIVRPILDIIEIGKQIDQNITIRKLEFKAIRKSIKQLRLKTPLFISAAFNIQCSQCTMVK
jgi:hypothetical protein